MYEISRQVVPSSFPLKRLKRKQGRSGKNTLPLNSALLTNLMPEKLSHAAMTEATANADRPKADSAMFSLRLAGDIPVTLSSSVRYAVDRIVDSIAVKSTVCHFMYWSSFAKARKDPQHTKALNIADFVLLDGVGLECYVKFLHRLRSANLNGTDLIPVLLERLHASGVPLALFGTTEDNLVKCVSSLRRKGISPYFFQNGYSDLNLESIHDNSVLFVGLGTPRQENWSMQHLDWAREHNISIVTVGGYFDFEGGVYKRAPKWIRQTRFEWLYRLAKNPRLHWRKYILNFTLPYWILRDKWFSSVAISNHPTSEIQR